VIEVRPLVEVVVEKENHHPLDGVVVIAVRIVEAEVEGEAVDRGVDLLEVEVVVKVSILPPTDAVVVVEEKIKIILLGENHLRNVTT